MNAFSLSNDRYRVSNIVIWKLPPDSKMATWICLSLLPKSHARSNVIAKVKLLFSTTSVQQDDESKMDWKELNRSPLDVQGLVRSFNPDSPTSNVLGGCARFWMIQFVCRALLTGFPLILLLQHNPSVGSSELVAVGVFC